MYLFLHSVHPLVIWILAEVEFKLVYCPKAGGAAEIWILAEVEFKWTYKNKNGDTFYIWILAEVEFKWD